MKILYFHITQNIGGVEKRFLNYYKYILSLNDNCYTIVISRSFLKKVEDELPCINGHHVLLYGMEWISSNKWTRYVDYMCLLPCLIKLSVHKFDIAHFPTSASRLFYSAVRAKRKVISAVTSSKKGLEICVNSNRFKSLIEKGALVDCLDDNIRAYIILKYPQHREQVFVSPCSFIDYTNTTCVYSKKEHAISFVGRVIVYKGADWLRDSLLEIVKKTNLNVYILGNGKLKTDLQELVEKNHLANRVILTYSKSPIDYMKRTKIFLSLQKDENYPSQSLLEAMATQNAIIATDVGLTRKIVKENFGILVSDRQEMIDAIVRLEQIDLQEWGTNAMLFAKRNHKVSLFHQYLISMYKS